MTWRRALLSDPQGDAPCRKSVEISWHLRQPRLGDNVLIASDNAQQLDLNEGCNSGEIGDPLAQAHDLEFWDGSPASDSRVTTLAVCGVVFAIRTNSTRLKTYLLRPNWTELNWR